MGNLVLALGAMGLALVMFLCGLLESLDAIARMMAGAPWLWACLTAVFCFIACTRLTKYAGRKFKAWEQSREAKAERQRISPIPPPENVRVVATNYGLEVSWSYSDQKEQNICRFDIFVNDGAPPGIDYKYYRMSVPPSARRAQLFLPSGGNYYVTVAAVGKN